MNINRDVQRLFDLVRYCRADLHEDGLITDEEYAELLTTKGSVDRLHKYDKIIAENKELKEEILRVNGVGMCNLRRARDAEKGSRKLVEERDKYRDQLVGMLCEGGTTSGEGEDGKCTKGYSSYDDDGCMENNCPYWKTSNV